MITPIPRDEWDHMWAEIDPSKPMPLMKYSALVDRVKGKWHKQYPRLTFSNRRWVSHLEEVLRLGGTIPADVLNDLDMDKEAKYDRPAFAHLNAAISTRDGVQA